MITCRLSPKPPDLVLDPTCPKPSPKDMDHGDHVILDRSPSDHGDDATSNNSPLPH